VIVHDPWIMGKDQLDGGMSFDLRGIEDRHGAPALFDALVEIQILPRIRLQLFDLVRPKHSELPGIGSLRPSSQPDAPSSAVVSIDSAPVMTIRCWYGF